VIRARPAGVRAAGDASVASERDRLVTTLFLAALLHGLIILGVTFTSDRRSGDPAPGLDVQLLAEDAPDEARDRPAAYLAQASRVGAGTTTERIAARTPLGAPPEAESAERDDPAPPTDPSESPLATERPVLASASGRVTVRYVAAQVGDQGADPSSRVAEAAAALRAALAAIDAGGEDPVDAARLTGPKSAEGWVSPDTQASVVAPYLDAWRRKVERLGTLNYPSIARAASVPANPVLEIELAASGRMQSVRIRRSSGNVELDAAALQILRLASPFDPFPSDMAAAYPVLRFAYEWQFVERGTLAVPAP
jgi:protein TonB